MDEGEVALEEQTAAAAVAAKNSASIFDLSQNKTMQGKQPQEAIESPSTLYARLTSSRSDYPIRNLEGVNQNDLAKKGRIPSQFAQVQGDLSSVSQLNSQPAFAPITEAGPSAAEVKTPINQLQRIKSIEALVNQIVDKVQEIRKGPGRDYRNSDYP